jgi:hypothetical protein
MRDVLFLIHVVSYAIGIMIAQTGGIVKNDPHDSCALFLDYFYLI